MSDTMIFGMGVLVTLIVLAGMAPLWWAAVLDGRLEE
jgi:hypothetical protein